MRTGSLPFVLAVIILNDEDLPQRNEVEKKASHDSLSLFNSDPIFSSSLLFWGPPVGM